MSEKMAESCLFSDLDISDDDSLISLVLQDNPLNFEMDKEEDEDNGRKINLTEQSKANEISKIDTACGVNEKDNVVDEEHIDDGTNTASTAKQNSKAEEVNTKTPSTEFEPRVLRERPQRPPKKKIDTYSPLVVGGMKLRLELKGVFSLDFDVPQQSAKWYTDFYDSFKDKYWNMEKKDPMTTCPRKSNYNCLICGYRTDRRGNLIAHLNRHMGYYIARCQRCPAKFYSLRCAHNHKRHCSKKN